MAKRGGMIFFTYLCTLKKWYNMDTSILHQLFVQHFGSEEGSLWTAPGRINLIGEHTDYNGGFVFPGAVSQGITAMICPNGGRRVRAYAVDLDLSCEFDIDDAKGPEAVHFRYVYGVVRELMAAGVPVEGFDTVYAGDVHAGRGDFVLQGADALAAPDLARCRVVQGRDDARDARDLADLLKRDRVEF